MVILVFSVCFVLCLAPVLEEYWKLQKMTDDPTSLPQVCVHLSSLRTPVGILYQYCKGDTHGYDIYWIRKMYRYSQTNDTPSIQCVW